MTSTGLRGLEELENELTNFSISPILKSSNPRILQSSNPQILQSSESSNSQWPFLPIHATLTAASWQKTTLQKIQRLATSKHPIQRLAWVMTKTPARHLMKAGTTACGLPWPCKRRKAARQLTLTPREREHVRSIREHGFCRFAPGELDPGLLDALLAHGNEKLARATEIARASTRGKKFWVRLSDDNANQGITTENPMVQVAIQESLLRIMSGHFGEIPFLSYVLLAYSQPLDGPLSISQLWHQDRDDIKILKLFVYLTDVNSVACGPFTLFDRGESKKIRAGFLMKYLPDEVVFRQVSADRKIEMIAPKLAAFLVDTEACYHMGSRVQPGHSRLHVFGGLHDASRDPAVGEEQ